MYVLIQRLKHPRQYTTFGLGSTMHTRNYNRNAERFIQRQEAAFPDLVQKYANHFNQFWLLSTEFAFAQLPFSSHILTRTETDIDSDQAFEVSYSVAVKDGADVGSAEDQCIATHNSLFSSIVNNLEQLKSLYDARVNGSASGTPSRSGDNGGGNTLSLQRNPRSTPLPRSPRGSEEFPRISLPIETTRRRHVTSNGSSRSKRRRSKPKGDDAPASLSQVQLTQNRVRTLSPNARTGRPRRAPFRGDRDLSGGFGVMSNLDAAVSFPLMYFVFHCTRQCRCADIFFCQEHFVEITDTSRFQIQTAAILCRYNQNFTGLYIRA